MITASSTRRRPGSGRGPIARDFTHGQEVPRPLLMNRLLFSLSHRMGEGWGEGSPRFLGSLGHYCFIGICALAILLGAGCASTSPSGASVKASLTVEGRTLEQIRLASIMVFQRNGFEVKSAFGRKLVFEKNAGAMNKVLYGGWMDSSVWVRVKIRIEELKADVQVLDCNVYRVKDRGDPVMEEEKQAFGKSSKPFKELLAQIKAQLDSLWPANDRPTPPSPTAK